MTPERWQKIGELVEAAAARRVAERPAFLAEACAGDEDLRREVEEMLAAYETPDSFIDAPLAEIAAGLLEDKPAESLIGRTLGHFRLESLLGRGGMGEVYLARDTNLSRQVAVKILPPSFAQDPRRVARFQQEARAASALNHPNIVTIYEFGAAEGVSYLVTEYVDGVTLRDMLHAPGLKPEQALDITAQTANALAAAHAAGIIHRDIKPENIMLRRDGYVKVLDFGLAKVTAEAAQSSLLSARARVTTQSGVVMGTASYMSPEQARGRKLDHSTDLFSLGVVLYELLTGQPPFTGETPSHTIVAIIEKDPPPLLSLAPAAPPQLQDIINRALAKDPAARYQTAHELQADLQAVTLAAPSGSAVSAAGRAFIAGATTQLDTGNTRPDPAAATNTTRETVAAKPFTGGWPLLSRRHFLRAGAGAGVTALGAWAGWRWWGSRKPAFDPAQARIRRLTTSDNLGGAILSADGQYVAYSVQDKGYTSLWAKHIANDSTRQIVPPTKAQLYGWRFAPRDNSLYYWAFDGANSTNNGIYRVPLLGGAPRRILEDGHHLGVFTSDGQRFSYLHEVDGKVEMGSANLEGEDRRILATFGPGNFRLWGMAWTPDGAALSYAMRDIRDGAIIFYVGEVPANGGAEKIILPPGVHTSIKSIAWLGDRRNLIYLAPDPYTKNSQIWHYDTATGAARRITNDLNEYIHLSASADGLAVLAMQQEMVSNIWTGANGGRDFRQVTGGRNTYNNLSWTPEGKIVYASNESGAEEIWQMDADGGNRQQLSLGLSGIWVTPVVSLDGRSIIFISSLSGTRQVWRMGLDGRNRQQLTNASISYIFNAQLLPDGQTVIYQGQQGGEHLGLYRQAANGDTQPLTPTNGKAHEWDMAPDGKLLAYSFRPAGASRASLHIYSLADNKLLQTLELDYDNWRWAGSSQRLAYQDETGRIMTRELAGGAAQPLFNPSIDPLLSASWSRDGKQLALVCGKFVNAALLLRFAEQ